MRKLLYFIMVVTISMTFCCSTAFAAAVTIHNGAELGVNSLSANEYVSDIVENDGILYFMVEENKIICCDVNGTGHTAVYTPETAVPDENLHFLSMEPAASGGLWVQLEDNRTQNPYVALFKNGQLASLQKCSDRAVLSTDGAIWKEGAEFICWDGLNLKRFPIPAPAGDINQFILWNGLPCFVDDAAKSVLAYQTDGQTKSVYSLPDGGCTARMAACGGEVYLSHCVSNGVSPFTTDRSLVRLSDGKQLSENYYNIQQLRLQADGAIQIAVTDGFGNFIHYTQVSITQDSVTEREIGEYLVTADGRIPETGEDGLPSGWRYTDSMGNQWIYSGRTGVEKGAAAVTKVTPDGTTVNYTAESLSGFALYYQGTGVSFDVEPYITDTGYTMLPVRGAAYLLNADIAWDGAAQTVTVTRGEQTVQLTIGSTTALADGVEVSLGTPAVIAGGRTMLPLRFLTETLGGTIRWEDGAVYID